jgi:hypothetical protein
MFVTYESAKWARLLHNIELERLASDKCSNLLSLRVSYEEKEALLIWAMIVVLFRLLFKKTTQANMPQLHKTHHATITPAFLGNLHNPNTWAIPIIRSKDLSGAVSAKSRIEIIFLWQRLKNLWPELLRLKKDTFQLQICCITFLTFFDFRSGPED